MTPYQEFTEKNHMDPLPDLKLFWIKNVSDTTRGTIAAVPDAHRKGGKGVNIDPPPPPQELSKISLIKMH